MKKSEGGTEQKQDIQCIEVLIPKDFLVKDNLDHLLSLYSVQNAPIGNNPFSYSEMFHFMVYDWKRTLENLLGNCRVPYTILRYFSPETIYYHKIKGQPDVEKSVTAPENNLSEVSRENAALILES